MYEVIFVPRAFRSTARQEVIKVSGCDGIDQKLLKSLEVKAQNSSDVLINVSFDKLSIDNFT
jgi:hypothetical protein